jgi:hypothetical protein
MSDFLEPRNIQIDFFLDGKKYAMRHSVHVPSIGDEVRFRGIAYEVVYRIWIYDEQYPRVALQMTKVKAVNSDRPRRTKLSPAPPPAQPEAGE